MLDFVLFFRILGVFADRLLGGHAIAFLGPGA
jgi:hypothetical protein